MESANNVYIDKRYNLSPVFELRSSQYFGSVPDKVDFALNSEEERLKINQWVESKTQQKIQDLLPSGSVSSNTKMILVNALYFKGLWLNQFEKQNTNESGEFILANGEVVQTPMMTVEANLKSVQMNFGQILKLPYKNEQLAMYIFAPDDGHDISEVLKELKDIEEVEDLLEVSLVQVTMPKFKIESKFELDTTLKNLGKVLLFKIFCNSGIMLEILTSFA